MTPGEFDDLWDGLDDDSFTSDPPNAVLTYWEGDGLAGTPRTVVCEIDRDAGYRLSDGTFRFGITPLDPLDAVIPGQLHGASLFVDGVNDVGSGGGCPLTAEQEASIDRVVAVDNGALQVVVTDQGTEFELMLLCDPRVEDSGALQVTLETASGAQQTGCEQQWYGDAWPGGWWCGSSPPVLTCDGDAIVVDKAQLKSKRYPDCVDGNVCHLELAFRSPATGEPIATSELDLTMLNGNGMYDPELDLEFSPSCG